MKRTFKLAAFLCLAAAPSIAQTSAEEEWTPVSFAEPVDQFVENQFVERRLRAMDSLSDGVLLIHARP
ncbi:MAG: hypothetical protein HKN13_13470, partial [Rhodothermales bacterium]|nr:hypothetical protein [Rhodothermales bacterium]